MIGINHTCSTVDLRDRLFIRESQLGKAYALLSSSPELRETLILSTCNRVEIYAVTSNIGDAEKLLTKILSEFHSIPVEDFQSHLYFFHCLKAVEHLYQVVASLDSLVIGDYQILAQVKRAYRLACQYRATGQVLNKLFHFAITAGKRVHTETRISEGVVSIASVAVDLAEKLIGKLDTVTALIIGAGQMSKLTARHLTSAGVKKIYFANRTREHATELATLFNGIPLSLLEWTTVFQNCDIVLSSTSAPHYIITPELVSSAMSARKHRPFFLIDIAAPRDIDPSVKEIDNVFLYNIDDLTGVANENTRLRKDKIVKARHVLDEEISRYVEWYASLKILPALLSLRKNFETIRDNELQRYSSALTRLPDTEQETFRQFAESLTEKFLNVPSRVLKEKSAEEDCALFADLLMDLFQLRVNDEP